MVVSRRLAIRGGQRRGKLPIESRSGTKTTIQRGMRAGASLRRPCLCRCRIAQMVAIVALVGWIGGLPATRGIDHDHGFVGVIVNAKVIGDRTVLRMSPAVDGLPIALDDVTDDFVAIEFEVGFEGRLASFYVIKVAFDVSQVTAMRRVPKQVGGAVGIDRPRPLNGDVLGVEGLPGTDFATWQEFTRMLAIAHHRAIGIFHGDPLDHDSTHPAMNQHAGVDVLHQAAGLRVLRTVHVNRSLAEDVDLFDVLSLSPMTDADTVSHWAIVGDEPQAPSAVSRAVFEADFYTMAQRLPVAGDRDLLVWRVEDFAVAPRKRIRHAVRTGAINHDRVNGCPIRLGAIHRCR